MIIAKGFFAFPFWRFLEPSDRSIAGNSRSIGSVMSRQMCWHFKSTGKLHEGQEILLVLFNCLIASGVLFAYQLKVTEIFVFAWQKKLLGFFSFILIVNFLTSDFQYLFIQNIILKLSVFKWCCALQWARI